MECYFRRHRRQDEYMTDKAGKIKVSSVINILMKDKTEGPFGNRDIRITKNGRYMKITGHAGFDLAADIYAAGDAVPDDIKNVSQTAAAADDIRHMIFRIASAYDAGFGEIRITHDDRTKRAFAELYTELFDPEGTVSESDVENRVMVMVRTIEILAYISGRDPAEAKVFPASERCTPDQAKTARAVSGYIANHIGEKISMEELSCKFGISQTKLKDCFRSYYGHPVSVVIRKEKMDIAAGLLENTDMMIGNIGKKLGYMSAGKFTKAFHEVFGVNPGEYRRSV